MPGGFRTMAGTRITAQPSATARAGFRIPIAVRILAISAFSLIALAIALFVAAKQSIHDAVYAQILTRCNVAAGTLIYLAEAHGPPNVGTDGKLRFGSFVVDGDTSIVDKLQELTGAGSSIFGLIDGVPVRLSTTNYKPDSTERNTGTPLLGLARAAFDAGQPYTGVVTVAGKTFVARYYLLRDAAGRTVGVYSTNAPLAEMEAAVNQTTRVVLIIAVIALAVLLVPVFLIAQNISRTITTVSSSLDHIVTEDVNALTHTLGRLASGDLTAGFVSERVALKIGHNDEIADLTGSTNALTAALSSIRTVRGSDGKLTRAHLGRRADEQILSGGFRRSVGRGARIERRGESDRAGRRPGRLGRS
jgi:hypothetical protein